MIIDDKKRIPQVLKPFYEKYLELYRVNEAWKSGKIEEAFFRSWPIKVFVEPTNRCLMDCVYCARRAMKRPLGDMDFEIFTKVVNDLPPGTMVSLVGNGEPLMHHKIADMVKIAVDKGLVVSIITNAAALHRKAREALIESGIHRVQVSIDTIIPEVFSRLTGEKVKFEIVWKNFLEFLYQTRIRDKNIFITISAVMVEEVKENIEFLRWFWRKLPIDNFYEGPLLSLQVYSRRYKETLKENEEVPYKPCVNPWTIAMVNWDGSVNICPHDFLNLWPVGNVAEDNFAKVVNSEKAQRLREAILKKDTEFFENCGYHCHKCNVWHPEVEHSIEDWVNGYLPLLSGLTLVETTVKRTYSPETLEFLEFLYRKRDSFSEVLEKLKRDFDAERKRDPS